MIFLCFTLYVIVVALVENPEGEKHREKSPETENLIQSKPLSAGIICKRVLTILIIGMIFVIGIIVRVTIPSTHIDLKNGTYPYSHVNGTFTQFE